MSDFENVIQTTEQTPETEMDRAMREERPAWQSMHSINTTSVDSSRLAEGVDQIPTTGLDSLRGEERDLYESTRIKAWLSLIYGALTLMFLGFCAESGGKSTAFNYYLQRGVKKNVAVQTVNMGIKVYQYMDAATLTLLTGGYGFAAFCHFCAFVIAAAAAIFISPYLTGSSKEMSVLKGPVDFHREVYRKKSRGSTFGGSIGLGGGGGGRRL